MSAYDAAVTAELLALDEKHVPRGWYTHNLAAQLRAAYKRIEQLERALLKYGWHHPLCDFLVNEIPCTCGYEELRLPNSAPSEG